MGSDSPDVQDLDKYLLKRFDVIRMLGKGAYGVVWKVVEKESGRVLALKKCFDAFRNSTDAQRTFREIIFLQELNGHENIVRLMNVFKAESHQDLYVLFDYMESDLQRVIVAGMLQPLHTEYITYQILKALKYVHSAGVLHRDLKPANVLLRRNCHVRLCDFGLARTAALPGSNNPKAEAAQASALFTDYVATRWYRAPELLLGATLYSEGVDMWSVGCILGEMIAGRPILKGRSTMDQVEKILELTGKPNEQDVRPILQSSTYAKTMLESVGHVRQMPSSGVLFILKAPPDAKALLLSMLRFNPDKRPTAEASLEDAYVAKFHLQEAEPLCDKIIRMPIADTSKMKAAEYRAQIYQLIAQRRKMAKEEGAVTSRDARERDRSLDAPPPPGSATASPRSRAPRSTGNDEAAQGPWSHDGGAQAPPTTPTW